MTKTYDAKLQARLNAYADQLGSMAQVAQAVNLSKATLSDYKNSKYKGDVAAIEEKLRAHFATLDARAAQPSQFSPARINLMEYKPTSISQNVYSTIRYCQLERGISIVYGDSGIGKTMAAAKFVKDHPTQAVYVSVSPITGILSRFIKLLAEKLRIPEGRDLGRTVRAIQDKVQGTNMVIIIDEAQNLNFRAREEIRNWTQHDPETGRPGIGIVLIGNPKIYTQMLGKNREAHEQQFNRSRPQQYTRQRITREDVLMVFPGLAENRMEKETEYLLKVCHSDWSMRNATLIWNDAVNMEDVSISTLRGIAQGRNIMVA